MALSPASAPADVSAAAQLFDYRQAANPIRPGLCEPVPLRRWSASLHASGPSRIIDLDLSEELGAQIPCTSPALAASFIRLLGGDRLEVAAEATSSLFYVLQGSGRCRRPARGGSAPVEIEWGQGDLFVLPAGATPVLEGEQEAVLYWVHDAPLLHYLGATATTPRFEPCHYPAEWLLRELRAIAARPGSGSENRVSVLLANRDLPRTRTVSHTLWAMFGVVAGGTVQPPHRHQSVALDLIVAAPEGCHTLVGRDLDENGRILHPQRVDWEPGGVFITPPGLWHSHVNDAGEPAYLLPIQDAGLHAFLRSLDIRFR
ncbi:cupin [Synechococcus sp. RSCCF101]|uniref:cupin n=1 Tax=Synechococcus sp. RSCCF101 TaxID=2511069 RepID=UPI0012481302|nr:cupin [Synechococcus sp. RSCCF101]QEY31755.1 cupin [Synechococcus sp. RSCCF101]